MMDYKIETIPNYRIAYKRRIGLYGPENIDVMTELKGWASERNLLQSAILYAIPLDNPESTKPENCRFDACIVVERDYPLNNTIGERELLGGRYLIFKIKHTTEAIQEAYTKLHTWIQKSGYQMDNKPIMERYKADLLKNHYCEICVPIK